MIRPATDSELQTVQGLSRDAYAAWEPIIGGVPMPALEDYAPRIARGEVWLLERGAATVALIVLERAVDHLMIYSIAVLPSHQGQGHATSLLAFAEEKARALGYGEVRLYTNARMERNIAIYRAKGYRETGRRDHPIRPNTVTVDMAKQLTDNSLLAERVEVVGLDHLYLTVRDVAASEPFYDAVFGILDYRKTDTTIAGDPHRHYFNRIMQVSIRQAKTAAAHDPYAPGLHHVCFQVANNRAVDRFHTLVTERGIAATAPAIYPQYADDYYATFLSDPDGLRFEIIARRARRRLYAERWSELTTWLNPIARLKDV